MYDINTAQLREPGLCTTTIKEAMENIKRACALDGVSVVAPVETRITQSAPFMQMTDNQDSRNEPGRVIMLNLQVLNFKERWNI